MVRAAAYVDGFNLYRSMLSRHPDTKWLDFCALWDKWFDTFAVQCTYYFTAPVRALPLDPGAPARQRRYLDALTTLAPRVEIVNGDFRVEKTMMRPVSWGDRDRIEVWQNREKESDVNLASYLLRDVYTGRVDTAIVVTNDSDLVRPVQFALDHGARVMVCAPTGAPNDQLKSTGAAMFTLSRSRLLGAQFPSVVTDEAGRRIERPVEWR